MRGAEEQIRVGTQPQAEEALGFLRLNGKESHKAYASSVLAAFGGPMFRSATTPWTTRRPRGDTRCGGHRE